MLRVGSKDFVILSFYHIQIAMLMATTSATHGPQHLSAQHQVVLGFCCHITMTNNDAGCDNSVQEVCIFPLCLLIFSLSYKKKKLLCLGSYCNILMNKIVSLPVPHTAPNTLPIIISLSVITHHHPNDRHLRNGPFLQWWMLNPMLSSQLQI